MCKQFFFANIPIFLQNRYFNAYPVKSLAQKFTFQKKIVYLQRPCGNGIAVGTSSISTTANICRNKKTKASDFQEQCPAKQHLTT